MIIHRIFEPRWVKHGQKCNRALGFSKRCDGILSVQRDRLSGWPAHQAIPDLAIVLLPTLADRNVSISDPSMGHQLGIGVCSECSVKIPILRSDLMEIPASQPGALLWQSQLEFQETTDGQ